MPHSARLWRRLSRRSKKRLCQPGRDRRAGGAGEPVEVWFQDAARIAQKNPASPRRIRSPAAGRVAAAGWRPRRAQRTRAADLFGAFCPARGAAAGLVLPRCNTAALALYLAEISQAVTPGAHAVPLLDQAGWHLFDALAGPDNMTLIPLPPKSPKLNPVENIWQSRRDNWLSNRIFRSYEDILDHYCSAWNKLVDRPWAIMSIGLRAWAHRS